MIIDEDLLLAKGEIRYYKPNELIFCEDEFPFYYYQIINGKVKLNSYKEEGKEFIHNIFSDGQSFGEYTLFAEKPYPMNAETVTQSCIVRLPKQAFLELVGQSTELLSVIVKNLSHGMYDECIIKKYLTSLSPAVKIRGLLDYLKSFQKKKFLYSFKIPLTRNQMACLTGLCEETVIRTLKKMEKDKIVTIRNGKIFY
ncbi:CRP-like cAMP-binding protein [Chryseobacterium bernardetii]|jgi:CRP-like cAMP-binding protein|uniref:CRP-like cAMP-binding protein n=1 Tax=Chryseobacterium bernardetii TaxID=1241978 RepID=A0ACC6IV36_9FLAO|nr:MULTISPECIES: Crp/Fnr family transcriptional regulator [Chryseobacterium]MBP1164632.1 CRP-like cAMP-binding protein [Chryseobacterium sp. PvR013]MDR6370878.1 CRP-like cAMP-binding protein [Chryseobacterium vietnamense]MDR6441376.1 CRP-like cAMP-binding protein [Chryseobacterium bernardetii]MDR6461561.1 CRP-like cAMP-binding protein [Chryseobacterium sediminis]